MIHYIYTAFYYASILGAPLVRPVWFEFSEQPKFYKVESQFMFGDAMLVAPKLATPSKALEKMHLQEVTFTLPEGIKWYNYYNKKVETIAGIPVTRNLPDLEQAVFIKAGSIIPILLHEECMALMACFHNKIRLDVYLDDFLEASGSLFADDGVSFKYATENSFAMVKFTFKENDVMYLKSEVVSKGSYEFPATQTVDTVAIYGWTTKPLAVLNNGIYCEFNYNDGALVVSLPDGVSPG